MKSSQSRLLDELRDAARVTLGVLADTHAPRFWKTCPPQVREHLREVDVILHAGDVCTAEVLEELATHAPVFAVLGNNDGPDVAAWGAPERLELQIASARIGMIHDSGAATGRTTRLRRAFPDSDLVVFGHSHIPWDTEADGQRLFNPGSPTDRRRQPRGTMGIVEVRSGQVSTRIVPVTEARNSSAALAEPQ